jgi:hypothetical protein
VPGAAWAAEQGATPQAKLRTMNTALPHFLRCGTPLATRLEQQPDDLRA